MICPHCKKPIKREHTKDIMKSALKLIDEGYSARDVESLLERRVSFGTISKWARDRKALKGEE